MHLSGFSSAHDSALFIHKIDWGIVLLFLYVDNTIIICDGTPGIIELKQFQSEHLEANLTLFYGLQFTVDLL